MKTPWIVSFQFFPFYFLLVVLIFQDSSPQSCLLFSRNFKGELGRASVNICAASLGFQQCAA